MIATRICGIALCLVLASGVSMSAHASEGTPETEDGGTLYAQHCANCHGVFGEGDGIITPSLAVVLQDLRYLSRRNNGEFPREFIVDIIDGRAVRAAHGPEGMPVWGAEFARYEPFDDGSEARVTGRIEALTDFLENMQIGPPVSPNPPLNAPQ